MQVCMPRNAGICPELSKGYLKEVPYPLRRSFYIQVCPEFRVLGCHHYRTAPAAADPVLLACSGNKPRTGNGNSIRTNGNGFCKIAG